MKFVLGQRVEHMVPSNMPERTQKILAKHFLVGGTVVRVSKNGNALIKFDAAGEGFPSYRVTFTPECDIKPEGSSEMAPPHSAYRSLTLIK